MNPGERISGQNMTQALFDDCSLANARFNNINLAGVVFSDCNLANASFTNVNMAGVRIDDANVDGLTIMGHDIGALIRAEEARKA